MTTPQIKTDAAIQLKRRLSTQGEVLVRIGDNVSPEDVVAQAALPSQFSVVNVARALRIEQPDMMRVMQVSEGDTVSAGTVIALKKVPVGVFDKICYSPVAGIIAAVVGYRVLIEVESRWEQQRALMSARVAAVSHGYGATLATKGDMLTAVCATGTESFGELRVVAESDLTRAVIAGSDRGKILAVGGTVDGTALARAEAVGVAGIIAGSFDAKLLLTMPLVPIFATEGFGAQVMAAKTFALLQSDEGRQASLVFDISDSGRKIPIVVLNQSNLS